MEAKLKQIQKNLQQLCSKQEKCIADISDYLIRYNVPEQYHKPVTEQLIADRFVDEERYARAAVQDKFRLNRWGRIKIRYFLRSKRIPDENIERAIDSIDKDEYRQTVSQELAKKAGTLKKESREMHKKKLLQFAASRGYEEEIVREIWNTSDQAL